MKPAMYLPQEEMVVTGFDLDDVFTFVWVSFVFVSPAPATVDGVWWGSKNISWWMTGFIESQSLKPTHLVI